MKIIVEINDEELRRGLTPVLSPTNPAASADIRRLLTVWDSQATMTAPL